VKLAQVFKSSHVLLPRSFAGFDTMNPETKASPRSAIHSKNFISQVKELQSTTDTPTLDILSMRRYIISFLDWFFKFLAGSEASNTCTGSMTAMLVI
jgi:hypothetical protein